MKLIQCLAVSLFLLLILAGCTSTKDISSSGAIGCYRSATTPPWQTGPATYSEPIPSSWKTKSTEPPTAKITTAWKAAFAMPRRYNKILILGMMPERDNALQKNIEKHFVNELTGLGYYAVSSLQEFGPHFFTGMDEKTALSQLQSHSIDAILTITLPGKGRERRCMPGNIYHGSYGYYYNRFWSYSTVSYHRISNGDTVVTRYFWEMNLYDMDTRQLLYTAQTKSFDPTRTESLEYGSMILKNMLKQNVLLPYEQAATNSFAKGF